MLAIDLLGLVRNSLVAHGSREVKMLATLFVFSDSEIVSYILCFSFG
jgi:hypothetical protein